jgi:hypothetical protein
MARSDFVRKRGNLPRRERILANFPEEGSDAKNELMVGNRPDLPLTDAFTRKRIV